MNQLHHVNVVTRRSVSSADLLQGKKVSVFIDSHVVRGDSTPATPHRALFVTVYPVSGTIIGCAELFNARTVRFILPLPRKR